jgi:hypothetical protein
MRYVRRVEGRFHGTAVAADAVSHTKVMGW